MKSQRTKNLKTELWILRVISALLTAGPLIAFFIVGLISDSLVNTKVVLCAGLLVYIIMTIFALINKHICRSKIWIFILALYLILDNFVSAIIIFAVCQILDELLICPLKSSTKMKYISNKEIDNRE